MSIISNNSSINFPDGFLWGVSTSAFQIEGCPAESSCRLSDWSHWAARNDKIKDGSNADSACEFYWRYPQDLELCAQLNVNCFRLSLNWPVLRPAQTEQFALDREALAYYKKLLASIKERGMKTFVTLFHFCLPNWLSEVGGWNNPLTGKEFALYAEAVASELGPFVDYWLTLNEPLVYVYRGYINGDWPPGYSRNYLLAFQTIRALLEAHSAAYRVIHSVCPQAQVSYVIHWRPFEPKNWFNPLDQIVRFYRNQVFNHLFPRAVDTGILEFPFPIGSDPPVREIAGPVDGLKGTIDFLALNYYTREICEFKWSCPPDVFGVQSGVKRLETAGLGWEIYADGLYYLLVEDIAPYRYSAGGQPRDIFITENGMADEFSSDLNDGDWSLDDNQRIFYLVAHLVALAKAIADGVNVKGYLHWSLLDNFEWSDGLCPRFGLVRVSYPSQERVFRKSARIYADIIAGNKIAPALLALMTR